MINIQLILGDRGTEKCEPAPILKYPLEKYGIKFVDQNPDIVMMHSRLCNTINVKEPKILIERADSSIIYQQNVKELINEENTISVIKTTTARSLKTHNADRYSKRYHCQLINKYAKLGHSEKQIPVSESALKKIVCLIPTSIQDRFIEYKNSKPYKKREFDIIFVGATHYPGLRTPNALDWHRQLLVKKLQKLKHLKIFIQTAVHGEYPLPQEEYQHILMNSKICMSPWGMGEWNYRDFQSMYVKTILIKPNSEHVVTYPVDIFKDNKRYIPCLPDFSDLEQKIYQALDNWNNWDRQLEDNREMLIKSWNYDKLALDFSNEIKKAISQKLTSFL